jgi:hypothetical protein
MPTKEGLRTIAVRLSFSFFIGTFFFVIKADHMDEPLSEMSPVYVPDFKGPALAMARLSGHYTVCKKIFSEADWVTQDLRRHIKLCFPPVMPSTVGREVETR